MRRGLFALSAACLMAAPAVAQPPAPPGPEVPLPTVIGPAESQIQDTIIGGLNADCTPGPRAWGSVEYLQWWLSGGNTPELIQSVPTSQTTSVGTDTAITPTRVFPKEIDINFGSTSGIRATLGYVGNNLGFDISGFWLQERNLSDSLSSNGTPFAVGRQYVSAGDGTLRTLYASLQNEYSGTVSASTSAQVWGFDANVRAPFYHMLADWNHALAGFRYFNLEEQLNVNSQSFFLTGEQVLINDDIRTRNEFYGGQIGLASRYGGFERGFGLDAALKMALGATRQHVNLAGSNTTVFSNGREDTVDGGLYVQPTNAGSFDRNKIAFLTEYNLNLTYNFNPNIQVSLGYSLIWLSSVMRPGDSISPVINDSRVRYVADPSESNANLPAFTWNATDFWVQGVNIGFKYQY